LVVVLLWSLGLSVGFSGFSLEHNYKIRAKQRQIRGHTRKQPFIAPRQGLSCFAV